MKRAANAVSNWLIPSLFCWHSYMRAKCVWVFYRISWARNQNHVVLGLCPCDVSLVTTFQSSVTVWALGPCHCPGLWSLGPSRGLEGHVKVESLTLALVSRTELLLQYP